MLRTLIVEDEFTSRMILHSYLLPMGPCQLARDGAEALEAFAAACGTGAPFDLVCLDIHMPGGMDGHEVLRGIRELEAAAGAAGGKRSRVIMTTAADGRESIIDAFRSSCDGYLVKPIGKAELMSKLSALGLLG